MVDVGSRLRGRSAVWNGNNSSIIIIGDTIPIIAGATKFNFRVFGVAIVLGKLVKGIAIVFFGSLILPVIFP